MVENTFPQQDLGPLCPGNSHINRPLVLGGSRALSAPPCKVGSVPLMHTELHLQLLRVPIKQNLIAAF